MTLAGVLAGLAVVFLLLRSAWDWRGRNTTRQPAQLSERYKIWSTTHDEVVSAASLMTDGQKAAVARGKREDAVRKNQPAVEEEQDLAQSLGRSIRGADARACLLIDLSGSMERGGIGVAYRLAVAFANMCRAGGLAHEVLGFTTVNWKGAPLRDDWIRAGQPADPGRLCALRHVILSDGQGDNGLDALFLPDLLRENIDGEALLWARERLLALPPARHGQIFVLSDGAPVDDATLDANSATCLQDHLQEVLADIEGDRRLRIAGIGLGYDVARYYRDSLRVDDARTLASDVLPFMARRLSGGG